MPTVVHCCDTARTQLAAVHLLSSIGTSQYLLLLSAGLQARQPPRLSAPVCIVIKHFGVASHRQALPLHRQPAHAAHPLAWPNAVATCALAGPHPANSHVDHGAIDGSTALSYIPTAICTTSRDIDRAFFVGGYGIPQPNSRSRD